MAIAQQDPDLSRALGTAIKKKKKKHRSQKHSSLRKSLHSK